MPYLAFSWKWIWFFLWQPFMWKEQVPFLSIAYMYMFIEIIDFFVKYTLCYRVSNPRNSKHFGQWLYHITFLCVKGHLWSGVPNPNLTLSKLCDYHFQHRGTEIQAIKSPAPRGINPKLISKTFRISHYMYNDCYF